MTTKYCASAHKHYFCPTGTCRTCDRHRGMLIPVSRETAAKNVHFYAIYYVDMFGVLRWTVPPWVDDDKYRWRCHSVKLPDSDKLFMAQAAVAAGLPKYKRPVAQELPGVE